MTKPKLCAVVTSYNPDFGFKERLSHLSPQVDCIIIVDNNSDTIPKSLLFNLPSDLKAHIIYNSKNLGVATALNQGINWARENNYSWILCFDQDSLVSENFVDVLLFSYQKANDKDMIGLIGPGYVDDKSIFQNDISVSENSDNIKEVKFIITSGSLIAIDVYDRIGPFREDLFIDYIDIEYCLRARKKGYKILQTESPIMKHSIGSLTTHRLPWRTLGTSNHSPLRRYYMMRNHIVILKEYFFSFPGWAISSIYGRIVLFLKMILFEKNRMVKLKYSCLGFIDGTFGKFNRVLE